MKGLKYLKIGLFLSLLLLASGLFIGTNYFKNKLAQDEKLNVLLWAEGLQSRSNMLDITEEMFDGIRNDERVKVELWSKAMQLLLSNSGSCNIEFLLQIVANNRNVPVVLLSTQGKVLTVANVDSVISVGDILSDSVIANFSVHPPIEIKLKGQPTSNLYYKDSKLLGDLQEVLNQYRESIVTDIVENSVSVPVIVVRKIDSTIIKSGNLPVFATVDSLKQEMFYQEIFTDNPPIDLTLSKGEKALVFYKDSYLLNILIYVPYVMLFVLLLLILVAFLAFNASRKFDENQLWVGMSKETAHQLGTPISSLMAWVELLKINESQKEVALEMNKDVLRLETVANRFSKIGSEPTLTDENIITVCKNLMAYMKQRTSDSVEFKFSSSLPEIVLVPLSKDLFQWCLENLVRNAVDAMQGKGNLEFQLSEDNKAVKLEITDTGKGIARSQHKSIFKAGYTTKQRGWGLGLSLTKRIVEEYHNGQIFVKRSEINVGTTFCILLPKAYSNRK